jgi:hypothetical protein
VGSSFEEPSDGDPRREAAAFSLFEAKRNKARDSEGHSTEEEGDEEEMGVESMQEEVPDYVSDDDIL